MALRIISEEYLPRKPLIECEADSINDLNDLWPAEGSTAWIGDDKYIYENSTGWTLLGSGDFIVTLTPTAEDFSGTMDKTVAEISEAYQRGKRIVFRMVTDDGEMETELNAAAKSQESAYPSFNAYVVSGDMGVLVFIWTGMTDDGTSATYGTVLYALTPAT